MILGRRWKSDMNSMVARPEQHSLAMTPVTPIIGKRLGLWEKDVGRCSMFYWKNLGLEFSRELKCSECEWNCTDPEIVWGSNTTEALTRIRPAFDAGDIRNVDPSGVSCRGDAWSISHYVGDVALSPAAQTGHWAAWWCRLSEPHRPCVSFESRLSSQTKPKWRDCFQLVWALRQR